MPRQNFENIWEMAFCPLKEMPIWMRPNSDLDAGLQPARSACEAAP
jgi:hypothetical protein